MTKIAYRPDIDGLRAVAVLGVITYHAFSSALPGGFTGVDIFFVISGYLISGILYKGHKEGNFSFKEFYARRVRRLFPALITLLLVTMAYGWLILLTDEFEQLGKHVAAGILFIQNFVFWSESGYFDTDATLKPLLHLWSLAVEEQFYIFFPPILLLIWKRKWPLVIILSILLIISLFGNLVMSVQNRASDFFITTYRAWEFLGGSLLAWWHYDREHEKDVPSYREALSFGGLFLLALAMILIHKGDPYPGWRALLPVGGTLLLIEGGRYAWINKNILSNPIIVWIGLISYPLYLFHWPPLAFVHIIKGWNPSPSYIFWALGVGFALTLITYYLIEKPTRYSKSSKIVPILSGVFVVTGLLGTMVWRGVIHPSLDVRDPKMIKIEKVVKDREWWKGLNLVWSKERMKINKVGGNGPQTLFFGDSNTEQYAPRIYKVLKDNRGADRGALILACGGIPPLPGVTCPKRQLSGELVPKLYNTLASYPSIDRVVISALWPYCFGSPSEYLFDGKMISESPTKEATLLSFGKMVADLVAQGKEVTVVLSIPVGRELEPKRLYRRNFFTPSDDNRLVLTKEQFLKEYGSLLDQIATVAKANGASVIDPVNYLCKDGICIVEDENGPIHYDFGHLRSSFVREKVQYLDQTMAP